MRRRAERDALIARGRAYVEALADQVPDLAAAVGGSVARGDFNQWSDVDVVVISDALPVAPRARRAVERGDPLARETLAAGVPLRGTL